MLLEAFRPLLAAGRNSAHFFAIGVSGFSLFLFYVLLFRSARLPRWLTGYGVLASASQVCGVTLGIIDNHVPMLMLMPLALAQLILPLYFIVKGVTARDDLAV